MRYPILAAVIALLGALPALAQPAPDSPLLRPTHYLYCVSKYAILPESAPDLGGRPWARLWHRASPGMRT